MPEPRKLVPVDYRTLIQVFERAGFRISRQKGDHISMTKPGILRPLVIKTSPLLELHPDEPHRPRPEQDQRDEAYAKEPTRPCFHNVPA